MKKIILAILGAIIIAALCACTPKDETPDTSDNSMLMLHPDENDTRELLTLDTIKSLAAEKGEELTWSDFEKYRSKEIGSGLYILLYETDSDYTLWIGGVPGEKPMYIRIVSANDTDSYVDIRTEDIDAFLAGETNE